MSHLPLLPTRRRPVLFDDAVGVLASVGRVVAHEGGHRRPAQEALIGGHPDVVGAGQADTAVAARHEDSVGGRFEADDALIGSVAKDTVPAAALPGRASGAELHGHAELVLAGSGELPAERFVYDLGFGIGWQWRFGDGGVGVAVAL